MRTQDENAVKISILGTEYKITKKTKQEDIRLARCDGYIDTSVKKIVVGTYDRAIDANPAMAVDNSEYGEQWAMRHEIVHAFFFESGLDNDSGLGGNELLVDWIALQLPKMAKAMRKAGCLDCEAIP